MSKNQKWQNYGEMAKSDEMAKSGEMPKNGYNSKKRINWR